MKESSNILPSDTIPNDSGVTSHQHTCEENQNEKTAEVPHEQSITDTNEASSHDSVLRQECVFSSEKPKAELDLKTSSKIEMQNDKGLCDNGRESDKEVASDGLQRTCRQDMSHPSPDDEIEESNIPPGDKIADDTSQNDTCEENQNEKTEEVPHQQSNTDTYKARPHECVLHEGSDYSSEKPKSEPDLNTSSKKEPPQNEGEGDLDGESDTEMSSDKDCVDCPSEFILDEEYTSCESIIQLQIAAKDSTDHKEPAIDPNTLSRETSTHRPLLRQVNGRAKGPWILLVPDKGSIYGGQTHVEFGGPCHWLAVVGLCLLAVNMSKPPPGSKGRIADVGCPNRDMDLTSELQGPLWRALSAIARTVSVDQYLEIRQQIQVKVWIGAFQVAGRHQGK
ncbi:uncharacterized protein LOC143925163 [Lithobates pipiens]